MESIFKIFIVAIFIIFGLLVTALVFIISYTQQEMYRESPEGIKPFKRFKPLKFFKPLEEWAPLKNFEIARPDPIEVKIKEQPTLNSSRKVMLFI